MDNMNVMTFEDLQLEGPEGNKRQVLSILKKLSKVDMVSDIADFDSKAIKFDDVIATAKNLIDKKDPKKTQAVWGSIISSAANQ